MDIEPIHILTMRHELTHDQRAMLKRLGRGMIAMYGECKGPDLEKLRALGYVRVWMGIGPAPDEPFWPPPSDYHGVVLTLKGRVVVGDSNKGEPWELVD